MERFDCPIHSGPLVVVEEIRKGCGCTPAMSTFIHTLRFGDRYFIAFPSALPAACVRAAFEIECADCGAVSRAYYATRPYVEETVTA